MRLLQINATYGFGSTGIIMKLIHECALKNGIDSYIAFPKNSGTPDKRSIEIGNKFDHKLHALLSRAEGKQAYFSRIATLRFIRQLKELKPDIVHLHNLHSNYINLNMLLRHLAQNDIATVITMHDCWYFTGGCFHYSYAECRKWRQGCGECPKRYSDTPAYLHDSSVGILRDRIRFLNAIPRLTLVGCSEWITGECEKSSISPAALTTIHNGFDFHLYHPVKSDWRRRLNAENRFIILAPASKWMSDVNRDTLDYFRKNLNSGMLLLLFGSKKGDFIESPKIRHIGFIRNPLDMAALYSTADVLVNCSREDTLSSINIEAQACGTPVVTYDATGNKETVGNKSGFTVTTGDYNALFSKTKEIAISGKSLFSSDCISFVKENFERERNFSKYIDLYSSII